MSLLPQRKKTAEEIAKLRENLGVPASPADPAPPETPGSAADTIAPKSERHRGAATSQKSPHPPETSAPVHQAPKPVSSLKRSERPTGTEETHTGATPAPETVPHLPKPVRSLRKSEQVPVLVPAPVEPDENARIPIHRHSNDEIAEIRRREVFAMMNPPPPNHKFASAHISLLIPGYLSAIGGASCFFFPQLPMAATAGCCAAALLIACYVFARCPLSRHHACFIAVITLFVVIFGSLHYFPQLQHAT